MEWATIHTVLIIITPIGAIGTNIIHLFNINILAGMAILLITITTPVPFGVAVKMPAAPKDL